MSREYLKKLASDLKKTREEKNLTLEQIHGRTRIDLKFLEAIEAGHYDIMPDVYMKAFLKEYSSNIGLNPENVVEKYDLAKKGLPFEENDSIIEEEEPEQPKPKNIVFESPPEKSAPYPYKFKNNSSNVWFGIIGAVIVVGIVIVYFAFIRDTSDEIIIETPFEEIVETENKRFEVTEPENEIDNSKSIDSLVLKISANDTSWVLILIDGSLSKEYILVPNTSKSLTASSSFDVTLGNSGGVKLFLNNKELEFDGKQGSVRNLKIDKNGISDTITN